MAEKKIIEFYSNDKQLFKIILREVEIKLKQNYISQIIQNGSGMSSHEILEKGIDFNLDIQDDFTVYNKLKEITNSCSGPIEFKEKDKFDLSNHVIIKKKAELREKGFSTNRSTLVDEIAYIIFNASTIEKAKIHFNKEFLSPPSISYTLKADLGGKKGRIAISFQDGVQNKKLIKEINVVTILSLKK